MSKQQYKRLNISLPEDLLNEFTKYCQKEGMMLSSRIAVLIRKDLEQNKKK
ncbi:CopG family transcriptional regulator [Candidatus Woesearchaeota archaeon]|nr:CopG family transcriptional regulator [Candidatus Woesearchaeota archaeon]